MNIFDALKSGDLGSALQSLQGKAAGTARHAQENPGSMLGAGAIGALLGAMLPGGFMKKAALLGAGAVAWNFYRKWSAQKEQEAQEREAPGRPAAALEPARDPAATLMLRAMIYAARADGHIDEAERSRIVKLCAQFFPGHDVRSLVGSIVDEPLDPDLLASQAGSAEQREDLYRLSCLVLDIDHFMERGYLDHLASALGIAKGRQEELEAEAAEAKRGLDASN